MIGYTKLFGSIVASTIWREDDRTRIVWITMLALANKNGVVEASVPGLADLARVSVDDCRAAIVKLESPDPDSRTPDFEGRRIEKVDGGWAVLNHAKYRAKMGADERREYFRVKKAEERSRVKSASTNVQGVQDSHGQTALSTQSESEAQSQSPPVHLPARAASKGVVEGKDSELVPTTDQSRRFAKLMHRRENTAWSPKEVAAYKTLGTVPEEDLAAVEAYYAAGWPPRTGVNILRHDMLTLLNNFAGEIDRARNFKLNPKCHERTTANPRNDNANAGADYTQRPAPRAPKITDWAT